MRMLANPKVSAATIRCTVLSLGLLLISGCTTKNNPADLSATEWEAKTSIQDGKAVELDELQSQLTLTRNGTFRWTKGIGIKRHTQQGTYELSSGNQVVMNLKDEVEGSKTHVAEIILSKDKDGKPTKLVYKDDQGTIEFEPKKVSMDQ